MRLCLTVLAGQRAGEQLGLTPPGGSIGRSPDAAICLPEMSVSRQHADLRWDGKDWLIRGTSNSSPTAVDGTVINTAEVKLAAQGQLRLGTVLIQYAQQKMVEGEAAASHPLRTQVAPLPAAVIRQLEPVNLAQTLPPMPGGARRTASASAPVPAPMPASPPTLIRKPVAAAPPPESIPDAAPPTMLLPKFRPPVAAPVDSPAPPPTLIRPPSPRAGGAKPPPPPPAAIMRPSRPPPMPPGDPAPPTMIRRPAAPTQAAAPAVAPPLNAVATVEHAAAPAGLHSAPSNDELMKLLQRNEQLQSERDRLREEVAALKQELEAAHAAQRQAQAEQRPAPPVASPAPAADRGSGQEALRMTAELGDILEQASQALKGGDSSRAVSLIRSASFALADFRDLCQQGPPPS